MLDKSREKQTENMATEEFAGSNSPVTPSSDKPNRRKTSFVWDYFTVSPVDPRKAVCNNCGSEIVRGKDPRSFGTTSLASHIKYCYRTTAEGDYVKRIKRKRPLLANVPYKSPHNADSPASFSLSNDEISTYVLPNDEVGPLPDIVCSRRMDLIHSGHLMNVLYEQHKCGKFCDLTLISAPIVDVTPTIPHPSDATLFTTGRKGNKKEFRAHSSILAAVSAKIKTPIEMGSRTIELKDVTAFGLKSLLEIIYTGKLKRKKPLRFMEAHQIWKAASDLGVKYVHDYLVNEHPQVAKWISDEERKAAPAESFVYEITEDADSDLIDLCQGQPPNDVEENIQSQELVEKMDEEQQNNVEVTADVYNEFETQQAAERSNGGESVAKSDDSSMVEITFSKASDV